MVLGAKCCLLSNYLENRQQYVEHNRIRSSTKELKTGVPQGSVLGPFLFLIYINDLPLVCEKSKISLFADDTTVYNMGRNSEKELTEDVRKMRNWFDVNKLTLNVEKCESISFGRAQPVSEEAFGEKISCKSSCKYLGVLIDNKLNFKDHVDHVSKKLNKFCGLVYSIRHLYPLHCLLLFYKSYAKPLITYGLLNYGSTTKTNLQPIENAQRRIIRAMFFKKKSESLQNIIEDKKFPTVYEMYISELVIELFRQLRGISPFDHMKVHFVPYEINKRRKSKSLLPVTIDRTQLKRRSLKNAVIKTYNWLKSCDLMPQKVETLTNAQVKNHLRQIMELFIPNNKELFELFYVI